MPTSIPLQPTITQAGLAAALAVSGTGVAVSITQIAFGTAQYAPVGDETALHAEVAGARVNISGGGVIPASTQVQMHAEIMAALGNPFWCGEIGFYAGATLFAVYSRIASPIMYVSDQVVTTTTYALGLSALPAGSVTVSVDPSISAASNLVGAHESAANPHPQYLQHAVDIIPGGTTGQILVKNSNTSGDVGWSSLTSGISINVNTKEETQTLGGAQTVVNLGTVTTNGAVVYVGGSRLDKVTDWITNTVTQLTLSRTYPAGTKITIAQNEVAGQVINPLDSTKNLSDVQSASTARGNLGVAAAANGAHTGVTSIAQANVTNFVGVKGLKSLAGASAVLTPTVSGGVVTGVTISNGGFGYTTPSVTLTGGGGSGATVALTLTGSVITGVTVTNGGSGYATAPTATVNTGTLNLASADTHKVTVDASAALIFTNPPAGTHVFSFSIITVNDATAGRALSFPSGVKWAGGFLPPRTTAANAVDVWTFYTDDGGATYVGSLSIADAK